MLQTGIAAGRLCHRSAHSGPCARNLWHSGRARAFWAHGPGVRRAAKYWIIAKGHQAMTTTPPPGTGNGARSHLSVGSNISGELQFPGLVEVAGQLRGQVSAASIVVEETAVVEGDLTAKSIQIKGRVQGRLSGGDVRLMSSARVSGDIAYDALSIDSGAEVHAACKRRQSNE